MKLSFLITISCTTAIKTYPGLLVIKMSKEFYLRKIRKMYIFIRDYIRQLPLIFNTGSH